MGADRFAAASEVSPDFSVDSRDRPSDRQWVERGDHMLDEGAPPRPPVAAGPMYAVEELADRDHADGPLLVADQLISPIDLATLASDKEIRVDQDAQEPSGGPVSARIRRRSAANSSSIGGADSSSSRNRAGGRS
jgi:hypothetical protein